jgi:hypothetical protein
VRAVSQVIVEYALWLGIVFGFLFRAFDSDINSHNALIFVLGLPGTQN